MLFWLWSGHINFKLWHIYGCRAHGRITTATQSLVLLLKCPVWVESNLVKNGPWTLVSYRSFYVSLGVGSVQFSQNLQRHIHKHTQTHAYVCTYISTYMHILDYNILINAFILVVARKRSNALLLRASNLALSINWQGRIPLYSLH